MKPRSRRKSEAAEGRELNNVVARTTLRSHGLRPRGVIVAGVAGMRAMFVVVGSVAAGLVVHGRVRGGALALRKFCEFGLHGTRKSVPNSPG